MTKEKLFDKLIIMEKIPKELANIQGLEEFDTETIFYVYFLCDKGDLVYIGKTEHFLDDRIKEHKKSKVFTDCYRMKIQDRILCSKKEKELILKFKPKYNIQWITDNYDKVKGRYKDGKINIRVNIDIIKLKAKMQDLKLSVPKLAKLSGVLGGSIYHLLKNGRTSLLTLNKISSALNINPKDLMQ